MDSNPNNLYGGEGTQDYGHTAHELELEAQTKRCFLRPTGGARQAWDILQILFLFYVLITVPYRVCFSVDVETLSPSFFLEIVVDAYFIADIFVNFRTAYYDERTGELVIQECVIARSYGTSWFLLDAVSCFPARPAPSLSPYFVPVLLHVLLIELRQSLISYQYYHMLS